jgi:exopolysaccharide biosynthesis polyprenyl glycosylphosphotransferase
VNISIMNWPTISYPRDVSDRGEERTSPEKYNMMACVKRLVELGWPASLATLGIYGALPFWRVAAVGQGVLPLEILLTCGAVSLCRMLCLGKRKSWAQRDFSKRNILIVGVDAAARDVRDYLVSLRDAGGVFKGFVAVNEQSDDRVVGQEQILGNVRNVIALAKSLFVDEIMFAKWPGDGILNSVLQQAGSEGVDVSFVPSLGEILTFSDSLRYVDGLPTVVLLQKKKRPLLALAKRVLDITGACVGILLLLPLFVAIAVVIKLQSSGPILYLSKRVGYKGSTFTCCKFRTMVPAADSMLTEVAHLNERDGILFKITNDPRVTGAGAILRKYSLDELPQLWNVLRGDMSLVGPRPSISSEVAQYSTEHLRRLDVIPGMTGLWQVEGRGDPSFDEYIELDTKYVKTWSLWLDLKIIFRTVNVVLAGTGT